jgi:hypothetical protein
MPGVSELSGSIVSALPDPSAEAFLRWIQKLCGGQNNYEEWLHLAVQIRDHLRAEYENPALVPLVEQLSVDPSLRGIDPAEACGAIKVHALQVLQNNLRRNDINPDEAFPKMQESIEARTGTSFRFFSLNHDLLLDRWFQQHGLAFYDGFHSGEDGRPERRFAFDSGLFSNSPFTLLKLHGGIDWWRHQMHRGDNWPYEFIGVETGEQRDLSRLDEGPLILAGTFNKILQYSSPVFLQLFATFHATLKASNRLLVVGYGFADKGINSILVDWMCGSDERRLFVVGKDPFNQDRCRKAVLAKADQWEKEGRCQILRKYIGGGPDDTDWDEILQFADPDA